MKDFIHEKLAELLFTGKCEINNKDDGNEFIKYLNMTQVKFEYSENECIYNFISKM